jgi:aminoglycoside phosphotransferase (APT) family kinase protein
VATQGTQDAAELAPLSRIIHEVADNAQIMRAERLRGGVDALTHAVQLRRGVGPAEWLVVRRWKAQTLTWNPTAPERVWTTLHLLERHGVPAPRPVYLDAAGALVGEPTLVMTRVPGRATLAPADRSAYVRELGAALAAVHRLSVDEHVGLPRDVVPDLWAMTEPGGRLAGDEGAVILERLLRWRPQHERLGLVHGDYWAGNTLWEDGRLTSIVDWDQAALGDPNADVGYCRVDLALMFGLEAADEFLAAYAQASGSEPPTGGLGYWDLLAAVRALPDGSPWMPGYLDLGRTDLDVGTLQARLSQFIAKTLG